MDMERKYDRKLRQLGDELLELRIDILRYQAQINESWVSDEAEGINDLLERLTGQIRLTADEVYDIGQDIVKAYEELTEE
ncbi:MAG: hypothetical protein K1W27_05235 [Lachnospiraceae bacterium]|jgi:hypothetical protein|nr:hypothetical protein C804_00357 [Lachnospiraceae bacterium A4]